MHYALNTCLLSLYYGDQIVVFYHAVISKKGVMAAFGFIMISKLSLVGVGWVSLKDPGCVCLRKMKRGNFLHAKKLALTPKC